MPDETSSYFTTSDVRVILLLSFLLLAGGAVVLYQKSRAVVYPNVVTKHVEAADRRRWESAQGNDRVARSPMRGLKIDINTAPADSLRMLPGIGPAIAERIIQYRQKHGGFRTIDDIVDVSGIGDSKLEAIREYLIPIGNDSID